MTIDLDAIKARLAAACPGPWTGMTVKRFIDGDCLAIVREHPEGSHKSEKGTTLTIAATLLPQYGDNDTAAMLLHSRADMDALIAEVERLRGVNADLRLMVDGLETAAHEERAAVVSWLCEEANAPHPIEAGERALSPSGRGLLLLAASRIERGEHRREEKA